MTRAWRAQYTEQEKRWAAQDAAESRYVSRACVVVALAGFAIAVIAEQFTSSAGVAALLFTAGICWAAVFGALAVAVGL